MKFQLIIFIINIVFGLRDCPDGWIGRRCDKVIKPKWVGVGNVGNDSIELSWIQKQVHGDFSFSFFARTDSNNRNEIGISSRDDHRRGPGLDRIRRNSISTNQSNPFDSIEINLIPRIGKKSEEQTIVISVDPKSNTVTTSNLIPATEYRAVICNRIGDQLSEAILIDVRTKGETVEKHSKNECEDGNHTCSVNAACEDMKEEGYRCTCDDGYVGDGFKCQEIDECSIGTHECHENANCYNTPGFYKCKCRQGFHGNGRFCSKTKTNSKQNVLRRRKRRLRHRFTQ